MKLATLAALINLLGYSEAYRVSLEKGKRSVSGAVTISKINKEIEEMALLGDHTFDKPNT